MFCTHLLWWLRMGVMWPTTWVWSRDLNPAQLLLGVCRLGCIDFAGITSECESESRFLLHIRPTLIFSLLISHLENCPPASVTASCNELHEWQSDWDIQVPSDIHRSSVVACAARSAWKKRLNTKNYSTYEHALIMILKEVSVQFPLHRFWLFLRLPRALHFLSGWAEPQICTGDSPPLSSSLLLYCLQPSLIPSSYYSCSQRETGRASERARECQRMEAEIEEGL